MNEEEVIKEELTIGRLIDIALGVIQASTSNLDLNLDSILNVDDQSSLIVKLSEA